RGLTREFGLPPTIVAQAGGRCTKIRGALPPGDGPGCGTAMVRIEGRRRSGWLGSRFETPVERPARRRIDDSAPSLASRLPSVSSLESRLRSVSSLEFRLQAVRGLRLIAGVPPSGGPGSPAVGGTESSTPQRPKTTPLSALPGSRQS